MPLELHSPCKVNLLLNILGRRADGYHELETLMHPVALCDTLEFERGSGSQIELTCSAPALPTDRANLVYRAAESWRAAAGVRDGVRIHLEKRLPIAAGIGAGSANAAYTLRGLNQLFGAPLSPDALHDLAAQLGSDVPFFLQDRPAIASGRGERLEPIGPFPVLAEVWLLLVHPGFGISTAWAYGSLARFPEALNGRPGLARKLADRLEVGDLAGAAASCYNALEAPALEKFPILRLYQEFCRAHGAIVALMTGSGSATFALLPSEAAALELRERFVQRFGPCWTATVPLGKRPSGG